MDSIHAITANTVVIYNKAFMCVTVYGLNPISITELLQLKIPQEYNTKFLYTALPFKSSTMHYAGCCMPHTVCDNSNSENTNSFSTVSAGCMYKLFRLLLLNYSSYVNNEAMLSGILCAVTVL